MLSVLWPAHRPRCAARQRASTISNHDAQPMWLAASSRLLSDYFAIRQWLCVHTAIASLRFSLALRPSALSNL
eukprot:scaffold97865_cov70-Phaeocystis_antarctica.AAC.1